MNKSENRNVQIVLNAFDTLFNSRDYAARGALLVPELSPPYSPDPQNHSFSLSFIDVSAVLASGRHGSSATSCEWRTGCLRSTGT